jgi:hypothetical protein
MNFSICLASRERSQLLVALARSIKETTADTNNIELLVGIDDDDAEMHDCARHMTGWHNFIKFFSRARSKMLNRDYINWVYDITGRKGKYVIACNDDALFKTPNWDTIICEKMENYLSGKSDGIGYGFISDALLNRHGMQYCCFPLVTQKGVNSLGWVMPPEFPGWNADIALWRTYKSVNRIFDLSDVMIEHVSYHCGKRDRDNVSRHVESISNERIINAPVAEYGKILADAIKRG